MRLPHCKFNTSHHIVVVPLSIQSNNNNMTEHFQWIFQQWDGLFTFVVKGSKYDVHPYVVDEYNLTAEEVGQWMGGN